MEKITDFFGSNVFGDEVMKQTLPEDTYTALKDAISEGKAIDSDIADTVAEAMMNWAVSKGATHYTHWFQPMTGITAEKHDSFIVPTGNGQVIMEFSGKELIKGEPDASSFPSGGLRSTFEARGYTAWDPSSYAFVKENTLCIPTAFCSYNGEALDNKTPLLRSMEAINTEALRIAHLFGENDATKMNIEVGAEQEYFLVDKEIAAERPDLVFCGRTLIGAKPPKGQEMNDHYFGVIKPRVLEFMKDLDRSLWKLGVYAKTEHNEAAPSQHELAPVFTTANIATDQNQIIMELLKKVADRHGLVCLLHEKPFAGVNGSGKHNNWSVSTNTGLNFLRPGSKPEENKLFLLTIAAVMKAVDEHQDLLRLIVATAGNDHRLGGHEAPPAIISIYLGSEIEGLVEDIIKGEQHFSADRVKMSVGTDVIPKIKKDNADRNRTSPIAFTGQKFEFRMLGSNSSISDINTVINSIMATVFKEFADTLEAAENFDDAADELIKTTLTEHKRILFGGDGYSKEWQEEAEKRGLLNISGTPDAIPYLASDENISLFEKLGVFTRSELRSRMEIALESYSKTVRIEALTLMKMLRRDVMPAISNCEANLYSIAELKKKKPAAYELKTAEKLTAYNDNLYNLCEKLDSAVKEADGMTDIEEKAKFYGKNVLSVMEEIRLSADAAQEIAERNYWPYPSYSDLLFYL